MFDIIDLASVGSSRNAMNRENLMKLDFWSIWSRLVLFTRDFQRELNLIGYLTRIKTLNGCRFLNNENGFTLKAAISFSSTRRYSQRGQRSWTSFLFRGKIFQSPLPFCFFQSMTTQSNFQKQKFIQKQMRSWQSCFQLSASTTATRLTWKTRATFSSNQK